MLAAYTIAEARLMPVSAGPPLPAEAVWIDLHEPTAEEDREVERLVGISIPTREEMAEIEISSRLYSEDDALYMTASVVIAGDTADPQVSPVTFILSADRLVTVRYSEPRAFKTFLREAERTETKFRSADDILIGIVEAVVDRAADVLETINTETDAVSRDVFRSDGVTRSEPLEYRAILKRLGRSRDLNAKVGESLVSLDRLTHFLGAECEELHPHLRERLERVLADIRSLTEHAGQASGTAVFLLDATLGLINTEQNAIIKIISVISVVIMPPMLIASVYGMNFRFMPELGWRLGYPLVLVAMALAAVLPYLYFKRRGWL